MIFAIKSLWLFDVSSGFEDVWERGGEQVDDGDEGGGVALAAGACTCGLEDAVQAFKTGVGVG